MVADLEELIMRAAVYDRALPRVTGRGYARYWPGEGGGTSASGSGNGTLLASAIAAHHRLAWDRVGEIIRQCPLTTDQKRLVWYRLGGGVGEGRVRSWRQVSAMVGASHEACRTGYHRAIVELAEYCEKTI